MDVARVDDDGVSKLAGARSDRKRWGTVRRSNGLSVIDGRGIEQDGEASWRTETWY